MIKAASRGHISTVKLLLESGADKKIKNNMNNDVYICCQSPAVREVLDGKKTNINPFHFADNIYQMPSTSHQLVTKTDLYTVDWIKLDLFHSIL